MGGKILNSLGLTVTALEEFLQAYNDSVFFQKYPLSLYHVRKKGRRFYEDINCKDEPSLRELIQRSLEKERYVVEAAGDFQLCFTQN